MLIAIAFAILGQMNEVLRFLKLMQTTRAQPQYGYVLSGIQKGELSDLAQHHYLVTLIGWYLVRLIRENRGKVNLERVLEICLLHDLGELFGGDIGMPYAQANPTAQKLSRAFERENQRFLAEMLNPAGNVSPLFAETLSPTSDEGIIAKVADYMEVTHYKHYLGRLTDGDTMMVKKRMEKLFIDLKNAKTKVFLTDFIRDWANQLHTDDGSEVFEYAKRL